MILHKGFLQRVILITLCETFNRADLFAIGLNTKHQAGPDRRIINQNRTSAANAMFAAKMRAGLSAMVSDDVGERPAWIDRDVMVSSVNGERYVFFVTHDAAFSSARRTSVAVRSRRY